MMAKAAAKNALANPPPAAASKGAAAAARFHRHGTTNASVSGLASVAGLGSAANKSAAANTASETLVQSVLTAHGAPTNTLLRDAVTAFVSQELASIAAARASLVAAAARLKSVAESAPPHYVRAARDAARRAELVSRALLALDAREEGVPRAAHAYVQRFVHLETEQRRVESMASQLAQATDLRFLPTGGPGAGAGANQNANASSAGVGAGADAISGVTARGSLLSLTRTTRVNHAARIATELDRIYGRHETVGLMPADMCPRCNVAMQHNQTTQQLVCPMPGCYHWKRFADMTAQGLTFGEDFEFNKYTYRPVTHLDETMRNAEGAETFVVPFESLQRVMHMLWTQGIRNEQLTIPLVREVISKLQGIKTDNTVQIYSRLTGRAPRRMTAFMKDQNRILFLQQEEVFRKIPSTRLNNPSFPYTLYKNCELLGYWEMLESFPLLRGHTNLAMHDAIRAKVCENEGLAWQFIPTVPLDGTGCGSQPSHLEAAKLENARLRKAATNGARDGARDGAIDSTAEPGPAASKTKPKTLQTLLRAGA